jgi:serine/threonine-protein phosphatase PPG1
MPLDLDALLSRLYEGELLHEVIVREICCLLKEILMVEPNIAVLRSPVTVVGDVHGQLHDVLELFRVAGPAPDTNYLFLGDYVDRGNHSVETMTLLACLKLRYPHRITLTRGNHESRSVTQTYGFYTECQRKYGNFNVWKYFVELFDYLHLAAVVDDRVYAVHGGLSPFVSTLDQIRMLDRFQEVPFEGAITDMLWSDPEPERQGFSHSQRGAGYLFGGDVLEQFLWLNHLDHFTRAHQLVMEGYSVLWEGKFSTVWSAPNYCYRCGNLASVLEISEQDSLHFNVFAAAPETARKDTPDSRPLPEYFV